MVVKMRAPQKVVHDSERSMAIFSANLKENAMLQKTIQRLDKDEQTVVHRISVNQKVIHKRHQCKVYQTKLQHARAMQDRELERQVRKTHTLMLNTNLGQEDEEGDALKKIWHRGTTDIDNIRTGRIPELSALTINPRPHTTFATRNRQASPPKRPNTVPKKMPHQSSEPALPPIRIQSGSGHYIQTALDLDEPFDEILDSASDDSNGSHNQGDQCFLKVVIAVKTPRSRRGSARSAKGRDTSIFEEERKPPTLLEVQREKVKSANYEDKVRRFCEEIQPYRTDRGIEDYYMVRLLRGARQSNGTTCVLPTPDIEKRNMGDTRLKSMTFKPLSYEFNEHISGHLEQSPP